MEKALPDKIQMFTINLPTIDQVGRDLKHIPFWRLLLSLTAPFLMVLGFVGFATSGWWLSAIGCVVILSFITYGSISHDLVHRSLGLPRWLNDLLLSSIELLLFRSGRAYRLAHLNHHARYPDPNGDPEATAAHGTFWAAIKSGPFFFLRLWWWALNHYPAHRMRLFTEAAAILCLVVGSLVCALYSWTIVPVVYLILVYLGTWIVPLVTAYIPHSPRGDNPLSQTRRFRGWVIRLIALDHLYHLEHHLYPAVPHIKWAKLARRLDPYLDLAGVPTVRLGL
jgi:beta-carotene hydroxylase